MRIVDIRECAVPLKSNIRNSSFDFSEMTTSVVAVITDVMRGGKPVGPLSIRPALRLRRADARALHPRILAADPDAARRPGETSIRRKYRLHDAARNPAVRRALDRDGTIEVAAWDTVAEDRQPAAHRLLAERYNGGKPATKVFCYVGGGWAGPANHQGPAGRDAPPSAAGCTMVKMKVGGMPPARTCAGWRRSRASFRRRRTAVDAIRNFHATRRSPMRARACAVSAALVRAMRSARLRGAGGIASVYEPRSDRRDLFSTQDVENLVHSAGCVGPQRRHQSTRRSLWHRAAARTVAMLSARLAAARCFRTAATRCRSIAGGSASAAPNPSRRRGIRRLRR